MCASALRFTRPRSIASDDLLGLELESGTIKGGFRVEGEELVDRLFLGKLHKDRALRDRLRVSNTTHEEETAPPKRSQ